MFLALVFPFIWFSDGIETIDDVTTAQSTYHAEKTEKFEPIEFVAWKSPKSHCSAQCGPGVKTVTTVICIQKSIEDTTCKSNIHEEYCNEGNCPSGMSIWSEWLKCSKDCISLVTEQSVKTRSRTCDPSPCKFCSMEILPCEVPFCKPTCPNYIIENILADSNEPTRMNATFQIEKSTTLFGTIVSQEIKLIPLSDGESEKILKWNETELNSNISKSSLGLHRIHAYRPIIRVISQIPQENTLFLGRNTSLMIHECHSIEFTCKLWTCLDGRGTIPTLAVCNGTAECQDKSDESKKLCMGSHEPRNYIMIVISVVLGIGFALYTSEYILIL